jgi:D-alanyl-D-alanine carboxypeptidase
VVGALRRELDGFVAAQPVPGALALASGPAGDRVVTSGAADLAGAPLTAGHRFRVASLTKTFVATAALALAEEGAVALDEPCGAWLGDAVPGAGRITVRDLLAHTSGLPDYSDDPRSWAPYVTERSHRWEPRELLAIAAAHPPPFAPGAGCAYSNTNYVVAGLVLEAAAGEPLEAILRRRLFEPLALERTLFPADGALPEPYARGYFAPGNGYVDLPPGAMLDVTDIDPSLAWAAGALVSTADDVARFFRALVAGRLLAPASMAAMRTTRTTDEGIELGLGIVRGRLAPGSVWMKGGALPGYLARVIADEAARVVVVVLANAGPAPVEDAFVELAARVFAIAAEG